MRNFSLVALLTISTLFGALSASAQEAAATPAAPVTPASPYSRLFYLEGQLAVDGPLGIFGAAFGLMPIPNLAFDVGVGIGRDGYRIAGGGRLLFPVGHMAFGIHAGIATGPLNWSYGSFRREWDSEVFFDSDLNFEYRWDGGLFVRTYLGVEQALGGGGQRCVSNDPNVAGPATCVNDHPARPYFGVTMGYAFGQENARL